MMQLLENGKNRNFGPSFYPPKFLPWVLPLLVVKQCSKLSSYAISRKINGPNFKKMTKNQMHKFGPPNFFYRFYLYY